MLRYFIITIDTEGDNLWSSPRRITTRNSLYLTRFQQLCEKYGFLPTYLTNWEMANCPDFQSFGNDVLNRKTAEIGAHLHAWNNPPEKSLTDDDYQYLPYLIEYPEDLLREKLQALTDRLEAVFQVKMTSHRAGRWAFNETYAQALSDLGYIVDCSVTPGVDWSSVKGDPAGLGGTNYKSFPRTAYRMSKGNIGSRGQEGIWQIPMTTWPKYPSWVSKAKQTLKRLQGKGYRESMVWLRSKPDNLKEMKKAVLKSEKAGLEFVEYMLHSSEFMPGGSPGFPTAESVDNLYCNLEALFVWLQARGYQGITLSDYARKLELTA